MTDVADGLTNLTQTARDVAINNASTLAFADANNTDGWVVGPDGEFDGDPEEPRFAVLVFYCILVSAQVSARAHSHCHLSTHALRFCWLAQACQGLCFPL